MKFWTLTLAVVLGMAAVIGMVSYQCFCAVMPVASTQENDSLLWVRTEFNPSASQMEQIESLHTSYSAVCERHCEAIRQLRVEIKTLEQENAPADSIEKAKEHLSHIDAQCRQGLEAHVRKIAAILGEEKGARYLKLVLPRLASFDHAGAPDLNLENGDQPDGHHHH